jgi:hypothetical protein
MAGNGIRGASGDDEHQKKNKSTNQTRAYGRAIFARARPSPDDATCPFARFTNLCNDSIEFRPKLSTGVMNAITGINTNSRTIGP